MFVLKWTLMTYILQKLTLKKWPLCKSEDQKQVFQNKLYADTMSDIFIYIFVDVVRNIFIFVNYFVSFSLISKRYQNILVTLLLFYFYYYIIIIIITFIIIIILIIIIVVVVVFFVIIIIIIILIIIIISVVPLI